MITRGALRGPSSWLVSGLLLALLVLTACSSTSGSDGVPGTAHSTDSTGRPAKAGDAAVQIRPVLLVRSAGIVSGPAPSSATAHTATASPTDGSDPVWVTPDLVAAVRGLDCSATGRSTATATATATARPTTTRSTPLSTPVVDDLARPAVACGRGTDDAYLLGPAEVDGRDVARAEAVPESEANAAVGPEQWMITLTLTSAGRDRFAALTRRVSPLPEPRSQVAFVVDGVVLSAPRTREAITGGTLQLAGGFDETQARELVSRLTP